MTLCCEAFQSQEFANRVNQNGGFVSALVFLNIEVSEGVNERMYKQNGNVHKGAVETGGREILYLVIHMGVILWTHDLIHSMLEIV